MKLLGLSSDEVESHKAWLPIAYTRGSKVRYPILADPYSEIIVKLKMLDPDEKDYAGKPLASSALHIVGSDKKIYIHNQVFLRVSCACIIYEGIYVIRFCFRVLFRCIGYVLSL